MVDLSTEASEVLLSISRDEIEQARLMSELKYELDTQSKLVHAKREGRKEGLAEAHKEKIQTAINLKKLGVSTEIIEQATGLSVEEI